MRPVPGMTSILMYHNIGDPPPGVRNPGLYVAVADFEAQLAWLRRNGYVFLNLDQLRAGLLGQASSPKRSVVLTFDDGYEDNFTAALPALRRHSAQAVFFPVSGSLGGVDSVGRRYMDPAQLRELAAAGMQIGSHTVTHALLAKLTPDQAREELTRSKGALEEVTGAPVRWLCYPRGNFSRSVAELAAEVGYLGACAAIRGNRPHRRQLYWLPRVMVMRDTTPARLGHVLGWSYELLHRWKNRRRWKGFL